MNGLLFFPKQLVINKQLDIMADKKLKLEDFDGLTIKQLTSKIKKVTDLSFLSELEEREKKGENRIGALSAINERQGILVDQEKAENPITENDTIDPTKGMFEPETSDSASKEAATIASDEQPEGPEGNNGPDDSGLGDGTPGEDFGKGGLGDIEVNDTEEETGEKETNPFDVVIHKVREQRFELDRIKELGMHHRSVGEDFEDEIFLAKGWLGKLLGVLGAENPYKVDGGVKAINQIPPTAEVDNSLEFHQFRNAFSNKNGLDALQALRDRLQDVLDDIKNLNYDDLDLKDAYGEVSVCKTNAWTYGTNAKFFLGADLQKLRG